ncbi:pilin [Stenotrophomonas sp. PFBMAA-4]|uniref:pilin n=1 Tax=Stenotrophomonas sp. PFBMAA-4 TaxID=3043301 RepID=UPI0024B53295|nr:pilin [Stenotrophomonas sp. PFBMAA-4]MDI9274953.1 pilin [Stenotrophomonas sp. PFBMAA-4]
MHTGSDNPETGQTPARTIKDAGFSLIELMVVTAIIAVLAMIGLPQYHLFSTKAKIAAGLAEIAPAKAALEHLIAEGDDFDESKFGGLPYRLTYLGLPASGTSCSNILLANSNPSPYKEDFSIVCIIRNDGGTFVYLIRDHTTGAWRCEVAVKNAAVVPASCQHSDSIGP